MWFLITAAVVLLVPAFISISVADRGNLESMFGTFFFSLMALFPIWLVISCIVTGINQETVTSRWNISNVNQYTTDDGTNYSYRYKDKLVDFDYNDGDIRFTDDGQPYREKTCGKPVDGFLDMTTCEQYIYVTEEAK